MIAILFWSGTQNQEGDDASNDVDKNLGFEDRLLLPFTHQEEVVNFLYTKLMCILSRSVKMKGSNQCLWAELGERLDGSISESSANLEGISLIVVAGIRSKSDDLQRGHF